MQGLAERGLLIGDERWPPVARGTYAHHNPATGEVQAEVPRRPTRPTSTARCGRPRPPCPGWRGHGDAPAHRASCTGWPTCCRSTRAEAAAIGALDNGTPVSAINPGSFTASWVRYYAGWIDKLEGQVVPVARRPGLDYVVPEPYGVVGAIVPWNGPMMGMGQKVAPALAAGNTVVAKPPEIAPFGVIRFAELALEAGLPPGVLNVVPGGAEAGDALVRHPGVDKVSFTGGTATARQVMAAAAETLKPLALELGGKSANVVFPDADLDLRGLVGRVPGRRRCSAARAARCRPGSTCTTTSTTRSSSGWWRRWRRPRSATRSIRRVMVGPVVTEAACTASSA